MDAKVFNGRLNFAIVWLGELVSVRVNDEGAFGLFPKLSGKRVAQFEKDLIIICRAVAEVELRNFLAQMISTAASAVFVFVKRVNHFDVIVEGDERDSNISTELLSPCFSVGQGIDKA